MDKIALLKSIFVFSGLEEALLSKLASQFKQVKFSKDQSIFVEKDRKVFFPNVFSPNGDGHNDYFALFAGDDVKQINSFVVFNRWGAKVFETAGISPGKETLGWDGTLKGTVLNTGTFAYFAEIEFIDGEIIVFSGDVTLVR